MGFRSYRFGDVGKPKPVPAKRAKKPVDPVLSLRVKQAHAMSNMRAESFLRLCEQSQIAKPEREFMFLTDRRSRFDFAWPAQRVALESEGGTWSGGGHTRGKHYASDMDKYNAAALQGWCLLRVASDRLCTQGTIELVRQALKQRSAA